MPKCKKDFLFKTCIKSNNYLFLSKKGLESYFTGILIVSFFATFLLIFILGNIYVEDNPVCNDVSFEIKNQCYGATRDYTFEIQNLGNIPLNFKIGEEISSENYLDLESSIEVKIRSSVDKLEIVPIVSKKEESFECKGKKEILEKSRLLRC